MKHTCLLFLTIWLGLPSFASAEVTYPKHFFSVDYPEKWNVVIIDKDYQVMAFENKEQKKSALIIAKPKTDTESTNLEELVKEVREQAATQNNAPGKIDGPARYGKIGSRDYAMVTLKITAMKAAGEMLLTESDTYFYSIICFQMDADTLAAMDDEEFATVIRSFKVLPQP